MPAVDVDDDMRTVGFDVHVVPIADLEVLGDFFGFGEREPASAPGFVHAAGVARAVDFGLDAVHVAVGVFDDADVKP